MDKTEINNLIETVKTADPESEDYKNAMAGLLILAERAIKNAAHRYARSLQDPAVSCEDLVQDCNVKIIKSIRNLTTVAHVEAWHSWVYGSACFACKNSLSGGPLGMIKNIQPKTLRKGFSAQRYENARGDAVRLDAPLYVDDDGEASNKDQYRQIPVPSTTDAEIFQKELIEIVTADCNPTQLRVFQKKMEMDGETFVEIGAALGLSGKSVSRHIDRIREKARLKFAHKSN